MQRKGDIDIEVINTYRIYTHHTISEVLYISQLEEILLLIGCAFEKGMKGIFEDDGQNVYFYKKIKLIVKGNKLNNKLYKLNFISVLMIETNILKSVTLKQYKRLRYVNFKTLPYMVINSNI